MFEEKLLIFCEKFVNVGTKNIERVLALLVTEQCTVPFIARYRKEATGNLDEVQIRDIQSAYDNYLELEKRRSYIHETLKKMEVLTADIEKDIQLAQTLEQLEDIYAPYKSKKKTKAMIAKELGLEPLALMIINDRKDLAYLQAHFTLPPEVKTFEDALSGAKDIITEKIAHHLELKEELRKEYWEKAILQSTMRTKAEEVENHLNYKDFFDYKEVVPNLRLEKNSHRFLAMRRGMSEKVLKVEVTFDEALANVIIEKYFPINPNNRIIKEAITGAYNSYIHPSLDLEIKTELKRLADEAAIKVFGVNLKNLLLAPYLGAKRVMGIDPGVRTGCKTVVIDESGKLLLDLVIYPHEPYNKIKESKTVLENAIQHFQVEYIAIGNGTFGRETLSFVEDHLDPVISGKVKATMISESGASVYSASDIARKEFPDKDTTVRGAVSIARRFQDPLAELVKIDPKSIGVGQYQHDVNESKLKKSLTEIVESCVNYVGVDLNTASVPLLSYISGIGPKLAENIVGHRESKGKFKNREELLTISRFTQKIFQQSGGFLRIYQGENPLDATFIHPEKYPILKNWSEQHSIALEQLVHDNDIQTQLEKDRTLTTSIGEFTFKDILSSLKAPGQDPRKLFKSVEFSKKLRDFRDPTLGEWYTGIVNNITQFGAFVDLGIKESGLLHVSEMSDKFIENPFNHLQVGQEIKVRVISVEAERKRISLSCKSDTPIGASPAATAGATKGRADQHAKRHQNQEIKNNPFGILKDMKNLSFKK
ncbi:MAG: helix-hairpin-helix domain-containing protein [Oligoflexia bacterium]|nr:helix-hairpin-helix domain-containing protein [Oligoflexia bacterium]